MPPMASQLAPAAQGLRAAASSNIRGFGTELSENKGSLKTTFGENETALRFLATFGEEAQGAEPWRDPVTRSKDAPSSGKY